MVEARLSFHQHLAGVRLYTPGTIALYTILSLPVGMCLYGVNIYRRGRRLTGGLLSAMASTMFLVMLIAGTFGQRIGGFTILSLFVALGFFKRESERRHSVISSGATVAKWWPPLLFAIGAMLVMAFVNVIVAPEVVTE